MSILQHKPRNHTIKKKIHFRNTVRAYNGQTAPLAKNATVKYSKHAKFTTHHAYPNKNPYSNVHRSLLWSTSKNQLTARNKLTRYATSFHKKYRFLRKAPRTTFKKGNIEAVKQATYQRLHAESSESNSDTE